MIEEPKFSKRQREENEFDFVCQKCGWDGGLDLILDYTSQHIRETLLHCPECCTLYKIYYKMTKLVMLREPMGGKSE